MSDWKDLRRQINALRDEMIDLSAAMRKVGTKIAALDKWAADEEKAYKESIAEQEAPPAFPDWMPLPEPPKKEK